MKKVILTYKDETCDITLDNILIGQIKNINDKWVVYYYNPLNFETNTQIECAEMILNEFVNLTEAVYYSIQYFNVNTVIIPECYSY